MQKKNTQEKLYMTLLPRFIFQEEEKKVHCLCKSIYDPKKSSQLWFNKFKWCTSCLWLSAHAAWIKLFSRVWWRFYQGWGRVWVLNLIQITQNSLFRLELVFSFLSPFFLNGYPHPTLKVRLIPWIHETPANLKYQVTLERVEPETSRLSIEAQANWTTPVQVGVFLIFVS